MTTLNVLSAGAVKPALSTLGPAFGRNKGIEVTLAFGPAPEVRARVKDGTGDIGVLIGPKKLIADLTAEGKAAAEGRAVLGGVKAAIAVHRDAPAPDISNADAVRKAVRAASAIVYNTASSGQFIDQMIAGLGVMDEVAARIQRFANAEEAMRFLGSDAGRDAIGFGQSSAIRGYEKPLGVRQVGALPDDIGNVTEYQAAPAARAPEGALARDFIAYLVSPEGLAALRATGVE